MGTKIKQSWLPSNLLFVFFLGTAGAIAQVPARIEVKPLQTATPTGEQFLSGSAGHRGPFIAGVLTFPQYDKDKKLPALVPVHGSGGVGGDVVQWTKELNSIGIATFVLDSFTGRGITNVMYDHSQLGRVTMIYDEYRALELPASHPGIDPARIAIMGFSRGGQSTLYASLLRFKPMHGPSGAEFAAFVAFYASCNTWFVGEEDLGECPIRLFRGQADTYVSSEPCRAFVSRLNVAGRDVEPTEYPGADHNFDEPLRKTRTVFDQAQTTKNCSFDERDGPIINTETGKAFTYEDAGVVRGASVAYNEIAHRQSVEAVKEFFGTIFRLQ